MNNYSCYILISNTNTRTYIGCSNNINRRLRQHNGEIVGRQVGVAPKNTYTEAIDKLL